MSKIVDEIRSMSENELEASLIDVSQEIYHLRNELNSNNKLEKPHLLGALRKKRARILTILQEKGAK